MSQLTAQTGVLIALGAYFLFQTPVIGHEDW